jgi:hypothetical protein
VYKHESKKRKGKQQGSLSFMKTEKKEDITQPVLIV